jgi:hypothetical protein
VSERRFGHVYVSESLSMARREHIVNQGVDFMHDLPRSDVFVVLSEHSLARMREAGRRAFAQNVMLHSLGSVDPSLVREAEAFLSRPEDLKTGSPAADTNSATGNTESQKGPQ